MNRLLSNLSEDQTNDVQFYRIKKWEATKKDVFLNGKILIDKFKKSRKHSKCGEREERKQ